MHIVGHTATEIATALKKTENTNIPSWYNIKYIIRDFTTDTKPQFVLMDGLMYNFAMEL